MTLPQVTHPDAGLVLVGEWGTSGAAHQRAAADAALGAWEAVPAPEGLLSYGCLLGEDDRTLLHYVQWSGEDAARAFVSTDRWAAAVGEAVRRHRAPSDRALPAVPQRGSGRLPGRRRTRRDGHLRWSG
jgi:hypothetical protein